MRVYANIDMDSDDGLCFRMQSDKNDTLSLQNINVELSRLRLDELTEVLPYMPRLTGLFSAEANYIQTATSLQVSAEANVEKLTYERQPVGDIGLGATWLPGDKNTHYLNTYFTYDNEESDDRRRYLDAEERKGYPGSVHPFRAFSIEDGQCIHP